MIRRMPGSHRLARLRRRLGRLPRSARRRLGRAAAILGWRRFSRERPPRIVGIPMMNLHRLTRRVLDELDFADLDEVVIYDHGSDDPATIRWLAEVERRDKVTVDRRAAIPEESLYRSWNDTIRRALERHPGLEVDVVLLNNDVRLPEGFIGALAGALRSGDPRLAITYPDATASLEGGLPKRLEVTPTRGLKGEGGLEGHAFALKAELFRTELPFIDERLKFYSGDRDLVHNVEAAGYHAGRVIGLPCRHHWGGTRRRRPELKEQQQRDVSLWWGEHKARKAEAVAAKARHPIIGP